MDNIECYSYYLVNEMFEKYKEIVKNNNNKDIEFPNHILNFP